jgi:hypothetical protein
VYQLGTGEHLHFSPIAHSTENEHPLFGGVVCTWGPVVTVALGIVIGYTVFR